MDSSVAGILGAVIISRILIAILIVSGVWLGVGYFVANSKYDKGYLQGQENTRRIMLNSPLTIEEKKVLLKSK